MPKGHHNQYTLTRGAVRSESVPVTQLTPDEKATYVRFAKRFGVALAVMSRASYYCAGILDEYALDGLPDGLSTFVRKHKRFPTPEETVEL